MKPCLPFAKNYVVTLTLVSLNSKRAPVEVTISHLETTLSLDWNDPPREISLTLERLPERAISLVDARGTSQVLARCKRPTLRLVKALSAQQEPYDFEMMCALQASVLGEACAFRTLSANVRSRNERHAYFEKLPGMFAKKLARDAQDAIHFLLKAARLYLDVIFVHPFRDGNARAAMLSMAFYCWRNGYALPDFRKVFGFRFRPGSRLNYWAFVRFISEEVLHANNR